MLSSERHSGDAETDNTWSLSCRSSKASGEITNSVEEAGGTHIPVGSRWEGSSLRLAGTAGRWLEGRSEDPSLQLRGTNQILRASSLVGQYAQQHTLHSTDELGSGFSH